MVFNSFDFFIFFAIVYTLHIVIADKYRWILLLIASYFFYMYWEASYIVLIVTSTLIGYFFSRTLISSPEPEKRKLGVLLSVSANLSLLFFFKYYNFFQDTIAYTLSKYGIAYQPNVHELMLPIGISFYTFHIISYTVDVYRGELPAEKHLGKFALYVAFFPQLVAGPIVRAIDLLPQIKKDKVTIDHERLISGTAKICWGFFKKVVVADTIAIQVDAVYNNHEAYNGVTLLLATYLFAFQIYCDFSGYTDIALGLARIMGYDLKENFRLPYFSKNVTEFWRRWHISLSTWLRDYLYIPLGGSRGSKWKTYRNLFLTMLLGGMWHGASWNFLIWGAINGSYLAIEKALGLADSSWSKSSNLIIKFFNVFLCFNLICISWIFFRAVTFDQAVFISKAIIHLSGPPQIADFSVFTNIVIGLIVLLTVEIIWLRKNDFILYTKEWGYKPIAVFCSIMIILILLFGVSGSSQFIYFQF
ncbi:MAG: MBOAT family protein [Cytophagaceae bacterium]|nr:MBOAT family protein [Cytophagaceae bacterium]